MYLQNQLRLAFFGAETACSVDHRKFDDVRGGALYRGVQGDAFAERADVEDRRFQFGQVAAAAHDGCDVSPLLCCFDDLLHVTFNAGIGREVLIHIIVRLFAGNSEVFRECEAGDSVDDAEVDRFCAAAHLRSDRIRLNTEDLRRRDGVDVESAPEGVAHDFIAGDVGEEAQFNLGVIGVDQHIPRFRNEHAADFRSEFRADRDVLKIRLGGTEPSGCGRHHVEGGVDAPVGGDFGKEPVHIGGFEFHQLAEFHDGGYDGVLVAQCGEYFDIGGVSALRLFPGGEGELFKEQFAELFRGVDVELRSGKFKHLPPEFLNFPGEFYAEFLQHGAVGGNAVVFHFNKNFAERKFDRFKEMEHSGLFQFLCQRRNQCGDDRGILNGVRNGCVQFEFRNFGERTASGKRIKQIRGKSGVENKISGLLSRIQLPAHQRLDIVSGLPDSRLEIFVEKHFPGVVVKCVETVNGAVHENGTRVRGECGEPRFAAEFKQRLRFRRQHWKRCERLRRGTLRFFCRAAPARQLERFESGVNGLHFPTDAVRIAAVCADVFENFRERFSVFVFVFFIELFPGDSLEQRHNVLIERKSALQEQNGDDGIAGVSLPLGSVVVGGIEVAVPADTVGFCSVGRDDVGGGVLHGDASVGDRAVGFGYFFDWGQLPEIRAFHR